MARERTVLHGIVLRSVDTKETDKILTVLTDRLGKLPVVAKGARSRRSRVTAAAQLLAYSELTLGESHGWQYLNAGEPVELFDGLRRDVELLSLGCYLAELTEAACCGEPDEDRPFLPLLLNALYALGTLHRPPLLVKAAFELRLVAMAGFAPLVDSCCHCGQVEIEYPVLDLLGGVVSCKDCGLPGGRGMALTAAALAATRYVLGCEDKRLYSFTLPDKDLISFSRAAEAYTLTRLERDFSTLDFFKSLHI